VSKDGNGTVSVFGHSGVREGEPAYDLALSAGRRLAELGYAVACGGYGGAMEAAARGAKEAGGRTIGVTCSIWRSRANRFIDECVQTDSLDLRIARLIEIGRSGYVVLPGGTGTLRELATVWEALSIQAILGRPLVCIGSFWRPLVEMMASARPGCEECVALIDRAEELDAFFPMTR
jgi:uncharacterized protein (TIGR00725 family)